MIQLNLLPDVKATYVNAQRTKRTVITLSVIISSVAIGAVALLASVAYGAQALTLNNVQSDIDAAVTSIESEEDLDKVLTIQNQLINLDSLHEGKPVALRLFRYLQQTTPKDVKMDTYDTDFTANTMSITGNAPNLEIINKYVDTLKFTEIKQIQADEEAENPKAFSDVVLNSFSTGEKEYTYTITLMFDPSLFSSANTDIEIIVPKIITTRSETEKPGDLFKQNATDKEGQ